MKECIICSSILEDSQIECPSCGKSRFRKVPDSTKSVIRPFKKYSVNKNDLINQSVKIGKRCSICKESYDFTAVRLTVQ